MMIVVKKSLLTALLCLQASCAIKPANITDGVYWSKKLSEYLVVEDGFFRSYQWTPFACLETISGLVPATGSIHQPLGQLRVYDAQTDRLTLVRMSDSMPVHFEKVTALPRYCGTKVVATALSQWTVMQQTLALFGHTFPKKTQVSTLKAIAQIDARIDDTEYSELELFNTLAEALATTGDGHAFLYSRSLSMYWSTYTTKSHDNDIQGIPFCHDAIQLRTNPQGTLVQIKRLHSFDQQPYHDQPLPCLQEFARALASSTRDSSFLVVDLRNNPGGSLNYAAELLSILTGQAHSTLSYIGDVAIQASARYPTTTRPKQLYVAINQHTISAAEHLALALKNDGFTAIGATSTGAFSPAIVKTLPNGWFFGFSMYDTIYDAKKIPVPEGVGIFVEEQPDIQSIINLN